MKQKYCPYCDQKMETSHYCQECRRIVWHPYEQNVDYYLNERHPQSEQGCLYHNGPDHGTEAKKKTNSKPVSQTAQKRAQQPAWQTYETRQWTTGQSNRKKKSKNLVWIVGAIIAVSVIVNLASGLIFWGRHAAYQIEDMIYNLREGVLVDSTESAYSELTDEEVKAAGIACNTQGHYDVDLEEAATALENMLNADGYAWSMSPYSYNETDGEYNWYQTEYDYRVDNDDGSATGTTVEICADTATGQLHSIYIWSEDENQFLDLADITVKTMKSLDLLPGAPEGRVLYEESLDQNSYENDEIRYGAEIAGEDGGGNYYYQLRIMAPYE